MPELVKLTALIANGTPGGRRVEEVDERSLSGEDGEPGHGIGEKSSLRTKNEEVITSLVLTF